MDRELQRVIRIIYDEPDRFMSKIPEIERKIFRDISLLLKDLKLTPSGRIEPSIANLNLVNSIKGKLEKILVSKEYADLVRRFVGNMPAIANFQTSIPLLPPVAKKKINNVTRQNIDRTLESLIGAGYKKEVVAKLHRTLLTNVTTGGSFTQMVEDLREQLITTEERPGMLSKYARLYVTDGLGQFAGQGNKLIADALGSQWFRYTISNIKTTRDFCRNMTRKDYFHISEIPTLLTGLIDGRQVELNPATGLPKGMIDGTNEENFLVYRGGWNCRHVIVPTSEINVPAIHRQAVALNNDINRLFQPGARRHTSNMLFADPTGGLAPGIHALYGKLKNLTNLNLSNRKRAEILKDIVSNEGFKKLETGISKFATIEKTDIEFRNNIFGARALVKNGYNVFMLPNPKDFKSADFVLQKGNRFFYSEMKTIHGGSPETVVKQLNKAKAQSDRIILNVVGNISPRNLADGIQTFYENNPQVREIKVLKGGKEINVNARDASRRSFINDFTRRWSR